MSLKAFHVVFVVFSLGITIGFGLWALKTNPAYKGWGIASFVAAAGLLVYGVTFLQKLRKEKL